MWIKINNRRINLEEVCDYYITTNINEPKSWMNNVMYFYKKGCSESIQVTFKNSAKKGCEYIDMLFISGKYKESGMLNIDKEFEEKLKDIEFKTLEEFKEVK